MSKSPCYTFVQKNLPLSLRSRMSITEYVQRRISPEEAASLIAKHLGTSEFLFAEVYGALEEDVYRVYQVIEIRGVPIPFPSGKRHLTTEACPIQGDFIDLEKVEWKPLERDKGVVIELPQP